MRTLVGTLGVLLLTASGCVTIDQLQPTGGQSMGTTFGRAYFMKKTLFGTRVLVCDVRPSSGDVLCYEANSTGN